MAALKQQLVINDDDHTASSASAPQRKLYWQRFWLAAVFSCWGLIQSAMWNFYSPIQQEVKQVYGWSSDLIGLQANVAGIAFTVTIPFWAWVVDTRGARLTTVAGCILLSVCALLRCLPVPTHLHASVVIISMVFNGISAPPIALAPPIISASWFAASERTAATAVMTTMNYLGQAVGFLMGPAMVPNSLDCSGACHAADPAVPASCKVLINAETTHANIVRLYWTQAVLQLLITAAVVLYFPAQPPTAPTLSATEAKTDFSVGFSQLLRHRRFWVLVASFGLPVGVYGGWGVVLDLNLSNLGISQHDAAMIGFWSMVAGCGMGMLLGWVADRVALPAKQRYGGLKLFIVLLYAGALVCFGWFALMCCGSSNESASQSGADDCGGSNGTASQSGADDSSSSSVSGDATPATTMFDPICKAFPYSLGRVYGTCIGGGLCINAAIPLFCE
jgi:FLVCR family MFS transporter